MNSICDHAKSGICKMTLCDQAQIHDCGDYHRGDGKSPHCNLYPESKCVPVATVEPVRKPVRVRAFKEDIAAENVLLKMRVHQLECDIKRFVEMPTMRRIVWAWKGGAV